MFGFKMLLSLPLQWRSLAESKALDKFCLEKILWLKLLNFMNNFTHMRSRIIITSA
jgi:hypothetical protein